MDWESENIIAMFPLFMDMAYRLIVAPCPVGASFVLMTITSAFGDSTRNLYHCINKFYYVYDTMSCRSGARLD
jgi:hypothetical protein